MTLFSVEKKRVSERVRSFPRKKKWKLVKPRAIM